MAFTRFVGSRPTGSITLSAEPELPDSRQVCGPDGSGGPFNGIGFWAERKTGEALLAFTPQPHGAWRSPVARMHGVHEVLGSNPSAPTFPYDETIQPIIFRQPLFMDKIQLTHKELYWLAGLLEGDGSFEWAREKGATISKPRLTLKMTNEEVVRKVAKMLGYQCSEKEYPERPNWNKAFLVRLKGTKTAALMRTLAPLLGERRQQQIRKLLANYEPYKNYKLTFEEAEEIRKAFQKEQSAQNLAEEFGVSLRMIYTIVNHKTYVMDYNGTDLVEIRGQELGKKQRQLFWLAGLLEAEGSFQTPSPSSPNSPVISLTMTDRDVVERVGRLWEQAVGEYQRDKRYKKAYLTRLKGQKAVKMMNELYPLMSSRIQERIDTIREDYDPYEHTRLTYQDAEDIRERLEQGADVLDLAQEFGVSKSMIYKIKQGRYYQSDRQEEVRSQRSSSW